MSNSENRCRKHVSLRNIALWSLLALESLMRMKKVEMLYEMRAVILDRTSGVF